MHALDSKDASKVLHPVQQKIRVYNPSLLSELLIEAERAHAQQVHIVLLSETVCRICCL